MINRVYLSVADRGGKYLEIVDISLFVFIRKSVTGKIACYLFGSFCWVFGGRSGSAENHSIEASNPHSLTLK